MVLDLNRTKSLKEMNHNDYLREEIINKASSHFLFFSYKNLLTKTNKLHSTLIQY